MLHTVMNFVFNLQGYHPVWQSDATTKFNTSSYLRLESTYVSVDEELAP